MENLIGMRVKEVSILPYKRYYEVKINPRKRSSRRWQKKYKKRYRVRSEIVHWFKIVNTLYVSAEYMAKIKEQAK